MGDVPISITCLSLNIVWRLNFWYGRGAQLPFLLYFVTLCPIGNVGCKGKTEKSKKLLELNETTVL